jgi:hypothetical protein
MKCLLVGSITTALALGILLYTQGASAAPIRITDCTTIVLSGAYLVANNLPPLGEKTGDCLVVSADFVTIDLGGFVIRGNGSGAGLRTREGLQLRSVAVRNGTVTGFDVGILLISQTA